MSIQELIIYNSETGSVSKFYPFMLRHAKQWKEEPITFWEDILCKIKDKPLSLYLFIPFCYKFLGISLVELFFSLEGVSESTLHYIKDSLDPKYRWLNLSESDLDMVNSEDNALFKDLVDTKKRLVREGAKEVKTISLAHSPADGFDWDTFFLGRFNPS